MFSTEKRKREDPGNEVEYRSDVSKIIFFPSLNFLKFHSNSGETPPVTKQTSLSTG